MKYCPNLVNSRLKQQIVAYVIFTLDSIKWAQKPSHETVPLNFASERVR